MKAKAKSPLTRAEILKAVGFRPLKMRGVPAEVLEAENKATEDYLVGWVQGLASHIDQVDAESNKLKRNSAGKKPRPLRGAPTKGPSSGG
jgi:hypothetical protein